MSLIKEYVGSNKFYIHIRKQYKKGLLVRVPVIYQESKDKLRRILFDDQGKPVGFERLDSKAFTENSHKPIIYPSKELPFPLEFNAEVLCIRAKTRPAVLLNKACEYDIWKIIDRDRYLDSYLQLEKLWLILPIYSYRQEYDGTILPKFERFKQLVESLYFPCFFPFLGNRNCPFHDSFGMLHKLQCWHTSLISLSEYRLSDKVFELLNQNIIAYYTGEKVGEYAELREFFMDELKEKGITI